MNEKVRRHWQWGVLALVVLASRLSLLRVYNVELSQDGFEAVRTLDVIQTQGMQAVPRDLVDRFILHPLYMLLLAAVRMLTPAGVDFYLTARFLSALLACAAVLLVFEFTRRAFGGRAAWIAALFLAFAPTFLWESVTILSSTLFLTLYIAVLLALLQSRLRIAAFLALLASLTRYEGIVLFALVGVALAAREWMQRRATQESRWGDWAACIGFALAFPFVLAVTGLAAAGNPLEFLGAQSMAAIWLRFLAPGDFLKHGAFFVTQYPALLPGALVAAGLIGLVLTLVRRTADRQMRATALLLTTAALYLAFFEILVWFDYTTLEVRFLMYPGFPLLVFAGVAVAAGYESVPARFRAGGAVAAALVTLFLLGAGYQQGIAGMQFQYGMMASQREMADELARIIPPGRPANLLAYTGTAGALDLYGRQHGLQLTFTDFRFAPDDNPEQFLIDRKIQYVVYPAGNAFAKAKYPYLARFETQTHGPVTFQALTQFATAADNQLYSIWSVTW